MRLQGIPSLSPKIATNYPIHGRYLAIYPTFQKSIRVHNSNVARVPPRASKGITDLISPETSFRFLLEVQIGDDNLR
jgi:hypothetical protein